MPRAHTATAPSSDPRRVSVNRRTRGAVRRACHRNIAPANITHADAAIAVWGEGRVAMHLAPRSDSHDMGDSNPAATFGYVARELGKRRLAFICARESVGLNRLGPVLRQTFGV